MNAKAEEFLKSLKATVKVEAREHLQAIATGLLELEKASAPDAQRRLIDTVFRAAHSLKGAARAVNFSRVETICQSLEDTFAAWKREEIAPLPETLDAVHRTLDSLTSLLTVPETRQVT